MKTLNVFLFFVVAACSAQFDYSRHQYRTSTVRPVDYNNDVFNGDYSINPNSNLHFSFQQIRRDQPPQIEERVENLHKYLYQRPSTTTPPPHFAVRSQFEEPTEHFNVQPSVHHSHLPEAPRLADIDESAVINQITGRNHQYNSNPVQHQNYVQPTPVPRRVNTEVPSWTSAPVHNHRGGQHLRGSSNRGGPRHSESHIVNVEPQYQKVATTPRAPPPPGPTLTPWSGDNFGK